MCHHLHLRVMDVLFIAECSVQCHAYVLMGCVLQICPVPFHLYQSLCSSCGKP